MKERAWLTEIPAPLDQIVKEQIDLVYPSSFFAALPSRDFSSRADWATLAYISNSPSSDEWKGALDEQLADLHRELTLVTTEAYSEYLAWIEDDPQKVISFIDQGFEQEKVRRMLSPSEYDSPAEYMTGSHAFALERAASIYYRRRRIEEGDLVFARMQDVAAAAEPRIGISDYGDRALVDRAVQLLRMGREQEFYVLWDDWVMDGDSSEECRGMLRKAYLKHVTESGEAGRLDPFDVALETEDPYRRVENLLMVAVHFIDRERDYKYEEVSAKAKMTAVAISMGENRNFRPLLGYLTTMAELGLEVSLENFVFKLEDVALNELGRNNTWPLQGLLVGYGALGWFDELERLYERSKQKIDELQDAWRSMVIGSYAMALGRLGSIERIGELVGQVNDVSEAAGVLSNGTVGRIFGGEPIANLIPTIEKIISLEESVEIDDLEDEGQDEWFEARSLSEYSRWVIQTGIEAALKKHDWDTLTSFLSLNRLASEDVGELLLHAYQHEAGLKGLSWNLEFNSQV